MASFNEQINPGDHVVIALDLDQLFGAVSLENNGFTHTTISTYATAELVTDQIISALSFNVR